MHLLFGYRHVKICLHKGRLGAAGKMQTVMWVWWWVDFSLQDFPGIYPVIIRSASLNAAAFLTKPRPPHQGHARGLKGHTIVFKVREKTEMWIFPNLMIRDLLQPETRLPVALDSSLGSWISWAKFPYLLSLHSTPPMGRPACWGPFLRNVSHLPQVGCLVKMQIPASGGPPEV